MPDGITTIEEAFKAAKLEELNAGAAPEGVGAPPADPTSDGLAGGVDQPPDTDPETQALVDSLVEQPTETGPLVSFDDPRFWTQSVDVNGAMVTFGEMRNGYLRQDDYTKKTQQVAEQRRKLEEAERFYESFTADPAEFARAVAVEYGWLDKRATAPTVNVDIPKAPTDDELDARLQEMLDERVSSDPRVLEAQRVEALNVIDQEFDRIGEELKVTIPRELRQSLLAEADARQVYDFDLLLRARMSGHQRTSDNLIRSGASRPGSAGNLGQQTPEQAAPMTVEEAWAQAKAELQSGR